MLIIELPVALQIVMQNHTFEPGEYEVGEYSSAYFNYVHIRNYHALKSPIAEIEEKYKDCDQMERLHEVCMNVSGDNPWKVIDDLKWFAQTDFLADAIAVFEKHRDEQILDECRTLITVLRSWYLILRILSMPVQGHGSGRNTECFRQIGQRT